MVGWTRFNSVSHETHPSPQVVPPWHLRHGTGVHFFTAAAGSGEKPGDLPQITPSRGVGTPHALAHGGSACATVRGSEMKNEHCGGNSGSGFWRGLLWIAGFTLVFGLYADPVLARSHHHHHGHRRLTGCYFFSLRYRSN